MFEFLAGYLPFGDEMDDPYGIYKEILDHEELKQPEEIPNDNAFEFIKVLLSNQPNVRFNGSYAEVKARNYLKDFNWVTSVLLF